MESSKIYHYQTSQITNENGSLILCDDRAQGCFGIWARACWHQETMFCLFFSHQVRLNLAVPFRARVGKGAVLSVREQVRLSALLCSELMPCCNIPVMLRGRSPLQGICCSDGVVQMPLCLSVLCVSSRVRCVTCISSAELHQLVLLLVLGCPSFTSGVLGNLTFTKSLLS